MAYLEISKLSKSYGKTEILHPTSLQVEAGEFICFLGSSGSGKTTLLNCISGVVKPTGGQVILENKEITCTPLEKRNFGIVFQHYALFPNLTVFENIAYGLHRRTKKERVQRVDEMLELVGLGEYKERLPMQLSGGQRQRVAVARALAPSPKLLLMDEPLSALDANIRERLGEDVRRLQRTLRITTIMVTHDQKEAFALADRIAILHDGSLLQIDSPQKLYDAPNSRFVAEFIGDMNILHDDTGREFGIRYEDVLVREATEFILGEEDTFTAKIEDVRHFGSYIRLYCLLQDMNTRIVADLLPPRDSLSNIVAVTFSKDKRVFWS